VVVETIIVVVGTTIVIETNFTIVSATARTLK